MFTMSIMVNKSKYNNKYSKKGYSQERCSKHSYSPPEGHVKIAMRVRENIKVNKKILMVLENFIKNSLAKPAIIIIFMTSIMVFASKSLRLLVKMVLMSITRLSHMDMLVKEEAYVRKARR